MTLTAPYRCVAELRQAALPLVARIKQDLSPALDTAVDQLTRRQPLLGRIVGYHLGLNDADGTPQAGDTGGIAGTMALAALAAQAVGAPADTVTACALAMELAKDYTQLQDDIIDEDPVRRGRASAWKAFGTGPTVLAADAARALALDLLADHGPHGHAAARHLQTALDACTVGQARDIATAHRPWIGPEAVTLEEYRTTASNKTAALLACTLSLGAVLHGAQPDLTGQLQDAGRHLGMAWQPLDDILDIWGEQNEGGLDPGSNDLTTGKKTFPVITALAADTSHRARLAELLASRPHTPQQIRAAADLINAAGGRATAEAEVRTHFQDALHTLQTIPLAGPARTDLITLACLIGTRGTNQTLTIAFPEKEDD